MNIKSVLQYDARHGKQHETGVEYEVFAPGEQFYGSPTSAGQYFAEKQGVVYVYGKQDHEYE